MNYPELRTTLESALKAIENSHNYAVLGLSDYSDQHYDHYAALVSSVYRQIPTTTGDGKKWHNT